MSQLKNALPEDLDVTHTGEDRDKLVFELLDETEPPTAYEVEKAAYAQWLWELSKYDSIHLVRELENRGYTITRPGAKS